MNFRMAQLMLALLLACGAPLLADPVKIKGSSTFGEQLGPRLIDAYRAAHPDADIELESRNSGYGIMALLDQQCDIAASSRPLNEDEIRIITSRRLKVLTHTIGFYGVAVIVHPGNPVRNLADHRVRDIFTGIITNWSDVGGAAAPIATHIATRNSSTYLGFQELALANRPYRADAVEHTTYAEIAEAVHQDPFAIGFIAVPLLNLAPVRALHINGIPATSTAVADNLYPYARMLRFFTIKGRESPAASAFIKFVRSTEGQNILEDAGFVRRFQRRLSFGMETP